MRKLSSGFLTRFDTNLPVQLQEYGKKLKTFGLKTRGIVLLYLLHDFKAKTKVLMLAADQLCSYSASLFSHVQISSFLMVQHIFWV